MMGAPPTLLGANGSHINIGGAISHIRGALRELKYTSCGWRFLFSLGSGLDGGGGGVVVKQHARNRWPARVI